MFRLPTNELIDHVTSYSTPLDRKNGSGTAKTCSHGKLVRFSSPFRKAVNFGNHVPKNMATNQKRTDKLVVQLDNVERWILGGPIFVAAAW
jgi:hypothetical protein